MFSKKFPQKASKLEPREKNVGPFGNHLEGIWGQAVGY